MHDSFGIAFHLATDAHDISVHHRFRAELDVTHHGNDHSPYMAVNIGVAQYRHRRVVHVSTGYPCIADDRDHRIPHVAGRGG